MPNDFSPKVSQLIAVCVVHSSLLVWISSIHRQSTCKEVPFGYPAPKLLLVLLAFHLLSMWRYNELFHLLAWGLKSLPGILDCANNGFFFVGTLNSCLHHNSIVTGLKAGELLSNFLQYLINGITLSLD